MLWAFGLRFSFLNWQLGKNIVAEALLPVVLAEAEAGWDGENSYSHLVEAYMMYIPEMLDSNGRPPA